MEAVIVPMEVEALAVNDVVAERDNFRRWNYQYGNLNQYHAASPLGFEGNDVPMDSDKKTKRGIYLHWVLPRALRVKPGEEEFPLIPNRYLIVRYIDGYPMYSKSWVLEGDCPSSKIIPNKETLKMLYGMTVYPVTEALKTMWENSPDEYRQNARLQQTGDVITTVNLGVPFAADTWRERTDGDMFLTALGAGNPSFAAFTKHNGNIFSFHDNLTWMNPEDGKEYPLDEEDVSYFVAGWYSDPVKDIIHCKKTTAESLKFLEWTLSGEGQSDAAAAYYTGSVYHIPWRRKTAIPAEDELQRVKETGGIQVALGNNTLDSYLCMAATRMKEGQERSSMIQMLQAMYYDRSEQMARPDGIKQLQLDIHKGYFERQTNQIQWVSKTDAPIEANVLKHVNDLQKCYDLEAARLEYLQWELNSAWWIKEHLKALDQPCTIEERHFDPDKQGLSAELQKSMAIVNGFKVQLNSLLQAVGIDRLEAARPIEYKKAINPVVTISGLYPPKDMDRDSRLTVRRSVGLIRSCTRSGISHEAAKERVARLDLSKNLPDCINDILTEYVILHLTGQEDTIYEGDQPILRPILWKQPFEPMFMDWEVQYAHIPFTTGDYGNWEYDGLDYVLKREAQTVDGTNTKAFKGISLLSPHIAYVMKEAWGRYLQHCGEEGTDETEAIRNLMADMDHWPILTQELEQFDDMLAQRDCRMSAAAPFASLEHASIDSVPLMHDGPVSEYSGSRSGHAYLSDLRLYDKFGRVLDIIASSERAGSKAAVNFPLLCPRHMQPEKCILPGQNQVIQLKPRILQHSRLKLEFDNDAVRGFLLVNHLNGSVLLFHSDGQTNGSLALRQDRDGKRIVHHSSSNRSGETSELRNFIDSYVGMEQEPFYAFIRHIDRVFWTTDPLGERTDGNLSLLIGRPVALASLETGIELMGPVMKRIEDIGKDSRELSEIQKTRFSIRLGDREMRDDGMLGYFLEDDFAHFCKEGDYLNVQLNTVKKLTVLLDIRGGVHGFTGVLPTEYARLPEEAVKPARRGLESSFTIGPVLTSMSYQKHEDGSLEETVRLPRMAADNGLWSWYETEKDGLKKFGIQTTEKNTWLEGGAVSLRDGFLQFSQSFEKDLRKE